MLLVQLNRRDYPSELTVVVIFPPPLLFLLLSKAFKLVKVERLLNAMKTDTAYDYVAAVGEWIGRTGAAGLNDANSFVEAVSEIAESLKPIGFRRARSRECPPWLLALKAKARSMADGESDGGVVVEEEEIPSVVETGGVNHQPPVDVPASNAEDQLHPRTSTVAHDAGLDAEPRTTTTTSGAWKTGANELPPLPVQPASGYGEVPIATHHGQESTPDGFGLSVPPVPPYAVAPMTGGGPPVVPHPEVGHELDGNTPETDAPLRGTKSRTGSFNYWDAASRNQRKVRCWYFVRHFALWPGLDLEWWWIQCINFSPSFR